MTMADMHILMSNKLVFLGLSLLAEMCSRPSRLTMYTLQMLFRSPIRYILVYLKAYREKPNVFRNIFLCRTEWLFLWILRWHVRNIWMKWSINLIDYWRGLVWRNWQIREVFWSGRFIWAVGNLLGKMSFAVLFSVYWRYINFVYI